ncbi:hypothetical protein LTR66_010119 [Elasticomyces elasticus]|nr:hypothetical protein LTR28_007330 [Elasticomyces elasticus]KAK4981280.1 hypothetical protein LTR66_010119 [Elasticomyces elasticus]
MDINLTPTSAAPGSTSTPVIIRTVVQYREADSDIWVPVSETSQQATGLLSSALRTPGGVAVTATLRPQAQSPTPVALTIPSSIDEFAFAGPASAPNSDVPSLVVQDRVMECIDKHSPPGYLTMPALMEAAGISSWAASSIRTKATRAFKDGPITDLPAAIAYTEQCTHSSVRDKVKQVCDVLRAVALDEEVRGPTRDALKVAEGSLKCAEDLKRRRLPSHLSSTIKAKWVNDDPKVKELKTKVEHLRSSLRLLPSQRAQAARAESFLIEL